MGYVGARGRMPVKQKRFVIALFGLVVGVITLFIAYRFVAPLTVAVFLYYSTRRLPRARGHVRRHGPDTAAWR